MWKSDILASIAIATFTMFIMIFAGLVVSFVQQAPVFGYIVGFLSFFATGMFLLVGGCLFARQPLEEEKRYNGEGTPVPSMQRALFGRKLVIASVFLFLYGLLFTLMSLVLGL